MSLRVSAALAGLIGVSILSVAASPKAYACSQIATCTSPLRLFPIAENIPGNLVFFKVLANDPGTLSLRRADGTSIPAAIRMVGPDRVFAPLLELPPGLALQLDYDEVCPPSAPGLPAPRHFTFNFTTGPAAPLELPTPTLTLLERSVSDEDDVGFTRVMLKAACVSCSAAHLTDSFVTVGTDGVSVDGDGMIELQTSCRKPEYSTWNSCTGIEQYGAGEYMVDAYSEVVGSSTVPGHTQLEVEIGCGEGCALGNARGGGSAFTSALVVLALAGIRRRARRLQRAEYVLARPMGILRESCAPRAR